MRCSKRNVVSVLLLAVVCPLSAQTGATASFDGAGRSWLRHVRIAAYPLSSADAEKIVQQAEESGVYGIEVDNDIPGRYESLLDPTEKLEAIRRVAAAAHRHHNKAFVYIAGTECITAKGDGAHTLAKDHPDWLQRKKTGEPAIFDTKAAFWIAKGEEDAWISPYAASWRKLYMQRVRQIAATGIDGIYVDIPYWMTHFTGWEDTWASFDEATIAAFKRETGLDARRDVKIGDFQDEAFRRWVDFRVRTITDFLIEIGAQATSVNPNISLIPEIYPGIEEEAPRVGADVYQIYPHVDAIAHEYEFGGGDDHTAASRTPFDWMMYQIGIRSFRAFAGDRSTWILNYSWDGAAGVKPHDAMLNLFASELVAGANLWDARGHVMSGSNDMTTRSEVYHWVAMHDSLFAGKRVPLGNVGVYFSDMTRNQRPKEFVASYRGVLLMLLRSHVQFQIVTPRSLTNFSGKTLVLPDVQVLDASQASALHRWQAHGGRLVLTGKPDAKLNDVSEAERFPDHPERGYLERAEQQLDTPLAPEERKLLDAMSGKQTIAIDARGEVVAHAAMVDGVPSLFFANFSGLQAGKNATPTEEKGTGIDVPSAWGIHMHVLPFLGDEKVVEGEKAGSGIHFRLPALERASFVWFTR
ncbi:hypothetical protein [Silvibacterium acidisoli]|uniref:hypothetical protein n=1 Tax=Acidobacteriaceae bacterium ZG23-2 TaxID=2883246 RepID=UPI00406CFF62